MELPGPPALPYATRFNLRCISLAGYFDRIGLVITAAFWLRVSRGPATPLMHLFLLVETALYAAALAWRWRSGKAAHRGSYCRWRELLGLAQRVNEAVLGAAAGWTVAWLSQIRAAASGAAEPWAAARHATLLLLGSGAPAHALTWAKPVRLCLALPLHLFLAAALAWRGDDVCASPCMAGPEAERLTHRAFTLLSHARINSFGLNASLPRLPPQTECVAVLAYLQLVLGFLLPALGHAWLEARMFARHQRERRRAGLPPESGWQAAVYTSLGGLLEALAWPQALLALGILLSIFFDLSLLAAGVNAEA